MNKEKIIIFGAGKKGRLAAAFFKYDKEILGIVDNDKSKWGGKLEGFVIYPLEKMKKYLDEDVRIVIAIVAYEKVVLQLEENGIHNYVYFEDVYANDYSCKCRDIMDENITDEPAGQYTGKWIKNGWMNHFLSYLGDDFFERIPSDSKILDIGCGCGTQLFHYLCRGYNAYGIDCCDWKLGFCRQKIEDFDFPEEWKLRILEGKGEKLPWRDEEFDVISCYMVLEHVDDWRQCIREMLRVTRKGGIVRIMAPDYRNSYEEHYGIEFGKPLKDYREEFKKYLEANNKEMDTFNGLNFITKLEVLSEVNAYTICDLEIEDFAEKYPESCVVRIDGRLCYRHRIDLCIKKK